MSVYPHKVAFCLVAVGMMVVATRLSPVCASTAVKHCVVDTVGLVAAPPVGEVDQHIEFRTDAHEFLRIVFAVDRTVVHFLVKGAFRACAFAHCPVGAEAETELRRNPFAYIQRCVCAPTVLEIGFDVVVTELDVGAALGCDEPVVFRTVHEKTLRAVFHVGYFLCRSCADCKRCKGQ